MGFALVNIDQLRVGKSANFHGIKRRLSNAAIDSLFRQVRASHPSASNNLFHHRREAIGNARWSAVSFMYEQSPTFFLEDSAVHETICGFILLVEYRSHVAIFKSRLELPSEFVRTYLQRVSADRVDSAVARQGAVFEKIRLRNMSVSRFAMRNKTFEADDLRDVVGTAGSNRYAPQTYSVRSDTGHFSTTPNTGRIAQRSDRVDYESLVDYAKLVIDDLADGAAVPAAFIRNFARPISLESLDDNTRPVIFAVDVAGIGEAIHDRRDIRLVRDVGGHHVALSNVEVDAILSDLATAFEVQGDEKLLDLLRAGERVGAIALNKSRIALRYLQLPLCAEVEVESCDHPLGQDPDRMTIRRYLDRTDSFIVLFDQLNLAYIHGTLFRDDAIVGGGATFLRYLRPEALLVPVTSETGAFTVPQTTFDADSTFGVVIARVAEGDDILICDDLGDEWADFIGVNNGRTPPRITFYHAKHGPLSLGASPFHVSVSQAMKNLRRMNLAADEIDQKMAGWQTTYNNGGVATSIPRIIRGDAATLQDEIARARIAPDTTRRVFIVTSSLSRQAVENALAAITGGEAPDPYFVQLYWLLSSFFSACTDMNANGYVSCRP